MIYKVEMENNIDKQQSKGVQGMSGACTGKYDGLQGMTGDDRG